MSEDCIVLIVDGSVCAYTHFKFSGGEIQVRITDAARVKTARNAHIWADIRSSDDFMRLVLLMDAITHLNDDLPLELTIPYMPYGRQDRVVFPGEAFALNVFIRQLVAAIDQARVERVSTWDCHSRVTPEIFERCGFLDLDEYVPYQLIGMDNHRHQYKYVVAPDAGAVERAFDVRENIYPNAEVIEMTKSRDPDTGYLSVFGFATDITDMPKTAVDDILIVDDICDGGRTFIGQANALREAGFLGRIDLYITHGIFSAGFDKLSEVFDEVIIAHPMTDEPLPKNFRVIDLKALKGF